MHDNCRNLIAELEQYKSPEDMGLIKKAIDYAIKYHGSQLRESGDPYYLHPIEVASIITEMKLDTASVITALLHDTVEDTELTLDELRNEFGEEVAILVDGVTKLTKIKFQPDHIRQAENFRKLLLAMSEDIRVLIVKLADRLHNMRTLDHVKSPEKRTRIALETMEIYAPLTERIGIQKFKLELQDLSFKILHPEIRQSILLRLNKIAENGQDAVNIIVSDIQQTLKTHNIKAEVLGRQKTPYSIWMKMKQKNIIFEQLCDIMAFRVIVDEDHDCYKSLGAIHAEYKVVPDNFQDFISTPKSNGYQSLHTVVIGPAKQRIEVQIRTYAMHEIAELGVAAHWSYKQNYNAPGKQYRWLRELLGILEQTSDPEEFLQNTKLAMYYNQVFCFTPKGALIALPRGATPIDFAFAVHSDVGRTCVGAKINGRMVPLRVVINNGDQVEIITSKNVSISPSWEKIAVTGKAKSEIRKFVRSQHRQEYIKLGTAIFEKTLKNANIELTNDLNNQLLARFHKKNLDELYYSIGNGTITRDDIVQNIKPVRSKKSPLSFLNFRKTAKPDPKTSSDNNAVPIKGMIPGMALHYAGCCHPLPGDSIVGVVHTGKGITVHTSDCEMLENFASTPERIMELSWDSEKSRSPFIGRIKATIMNELGCLAVLAAEIAKEQGNITNFRVINRNPDFFEIVMDVEVAGVDHLNQIINSLRSKGPIHAAERFRV